MAAVGGELGGEFVRAEERRETRLDLHEIFFIVAYCYLRNCTGVCVYGFVRLCVCVCMCVTLCLCMWVSSVRACVW